MQHIEFSIANSNYKGSSTTRVYRLTMPVVFDDQLGGDCSL